MRVVLRSTLFSSSFFCGKKGHLQYPTSRSCTCRYVLTTLRELEIVSLATDAANPMNACLASEDSWEWAAGRCSERKLYVPNHGSIH